MIPRPLTSKVAAILAGHDVDPDVYDNLHAEEESAVFHLREWKEKWPSQTVVHDALMNYALKCARLLGEIDKRDATDSSAESEARDPRQAGAAMSDDNSSDRLIDISKISGCLMCTSRHLPQDAEAGVLFALMTILAFGPKGPAMALATLCPEHRNVTDEGVRRSNEVTDAGPPGDRQGGN